MWTTYSSVSKLGSQYLRHGNLYLFELRQDNSGVGSWVWPDCHILRTEYAEYIDGDNDEELLGDQVILHDQYTGCDDFKSWFYTSETQWFYNLPLSSPTIGKMSSGGF